MISENLKQLRKLKNKTQKQMAKLLNVSQNAYCKYELGATEPNIDTLKFLANYFDVSVDYIVGNDIKDKTVYTEEQRQIFNMVVNLNEINTLKAYSYIAGLLAGQE